MKEYLLSMIGTILLSSILTTLTPEGKTLSIIRNMTKLACLLVIVSPLIKVIKGETSDENSSGYFSETVIETDEEFIQYYGELRIAATENSLEQELLEKYEIASEVGMFWEWTESSSLYENGIRITMIKIELQEEASALLKKDILEYLTKNYCSEVLIE